MNNSTNDITNISNNMKQLTINDTTNKVVQTKTHYDMSGIYNVKGFLSYKAEMLQNSKYNTSNEPFEAHYQIKQLWLKKRN